MSPPKVISGEFLLWSQLLLVWSIAAYGVAADPLKGEAAGFRWKRWFLFVICRAIFSFSVTYGLSRSLILSFWVALIALAQPLSRSGLAMRWVAEFEVCCIAAFLAVTLALIRGLHLASECVPGSIVPAQVATLCLLASTLLVVVRGGTYLVRGVLRKLETPKAPERVDQTKESANSPVLPQTERISAPAAEFPPMMIDPEEYNRGRLIGNLERIVLTIVVAAGSYAALAFLVAAKGVVRSEEFEKSRDFTEYFLIGSLASVLVALCAGIAIRFAIVHLWPDLLTLQMQ